MMTVSRVHVLGDFRQLVDVLTLDEPTPAPQQSRNIASSNARGWSPATYVQLNPALGIAF